ncbi:hypothetical protein BU25DRAFT_454132 [Macroventuria anomochaeta]|uniref:Uncharacterized protein n=1 Tax=Macroventuria anomochaeta TaxID=301207 RepID=A0ACB6SFP5_9PLEO|nr:uncharacterized protein BU25DRAFT_454132 [Macroventuria anomochaeta]KAF2632981.1 hypothetical protein BU25DRAFT_454132 [Macroventuria anomochaeta]
MLFFPESPRFYCMQDDDAAGVAALTRVRQTNPDDDLLQKEYLSIKTEVIFEQSYNREKFPGDSGVALPCRLHHTLLHMALVQAHSYWLLCHVLPATHWLQCDHLLRSYHLWQLGLLGKTGGLLATGVYGIVNTLSTLPALFLIDKVGRKPLLLCGAAGTFISLVIVGGVIGEYGDTLRDHSAAGWTGIAFVYI